MSGYWQTFTPRIEENINIVGYVVEPEHLVGRVYLSGEDLQSPNTDGNVHGYLNLSVRQDIHF